MPKMSHHDNVNEQYASDANLRKRMRLHQLYSTARIGFTEWVLGQYRFSPGDRILECGCGNGAFWEAAADRLPIGCQLVLTDLSSGMTAEAAERHAARGNVAVQTADIAALPFADASFDAVIANHMLYHVPDLAAAFAEVRRVLRPGGAFYAVTNGTEGMSGYLHAALRDYDPSLDVYGEASSFTLQNGAALLAPYFAQVSVAEHEDSLKITDTGDLIAWIESTRSIVDIPESAMEGLYAYFDRIRRDEGSIRIPKQVGMFIARG